MKNMLFTLSISYDWTDIICIDPVDLAVLVGAIVLLVVLVEAIARLVELDLAVVPNSPVAQAAGQDIVLPVEAIVLLVGLVGTILADPADPVVATALLVDLVHLAEAIDPVDLEGIDLDLLEQEFLEEENPV